ncbi:polysaccharide biosynthesis protein [Paenibacillus doosanensis]|uniref:UDP-N-acetylglucosamine 4,6-dehydratase (Inverting) n=1 Tax=Paenibacillus konkukensis TaxID=2020716 RepID=A0ABY4RZ38_9BACL|nr:MULTISPECIES: polysaccharide biosynthesis protein [Paenibacillus]MCS7458833.1 polysaccharide biosynthesis protein [Paenibacillus doosanensis]UQZ86639.1 UDP-N-acetylglucosamine 4,6-dehydratase (inverting) [Paenibacillus konkukensis]
MFDSRKILITGGTGSWGYELTAQLLSKYDPLEIIVFTRNEANQVAMKNTFSDPRLRFCIGDIRDKQALLKACRDVDCLFHLAALKHVPVCEDQPFEALKTNVTGTQNVIEAAIEAKVKKVIYVSSDKAASPVNFYGMTKAIGEKLITQANLSSADTKFVCVRGGNVLGTNGSVIHVFRKQIVEKNQIGITDKAMTRFFLTLQEAIAMLLHAAEKGLGGETFVMKMPSCRIVDLAAVLSEALGKKDVDMVELGVRPGEKIEEILYSEYESHNTVLYDDEYMVILPPLDIPGLQKYYSRFPRAAAGSYASGQSLMNLHEIERMLLKGGFLP